MNPTTPEIATGRFRVFAARLRVTRKLTVSRGFQWMARKAQQCMQRMANFAQSASASMTGWCFRPFMMPQAVVRTAVAFAPVRPSRRELRNSKGDFYFYRGR